MADDEASHDRRRRPGPKLLLTLAVAAQVVIAVDFSLASVAMPSIERGLGITPAISQWVLTADLLAYAGFLIVGGRLADIFGQRAVLAWGLILFLSGSVLTSLANDLGVLFAARAMQGLGGALVYPSAFSILTITFPPGEQRFKAYTINMASQAIGVPILTIAAGWAITQFGWRSSFLLNVPLCITLLLLILAMGRMDGPSPTDRMRIPVGNAVILTCGMASAIYALSAFVAKDSAMRAQAPYVLAGAAAILLAFVIAERRSSSPLIPPALLRARIFAGGVVIVATIVLTGKALVVLSNIAFQKALSFTPLQASYMLLPMGVASLSLIPLSRLTGRFLLPYPKATLIGAFAILALYYLLLSITPGSSAIMMLVAVTFLAPFASVTGANMALSETLKTVPPAQQGVATAIIYTVVQMFSAIGMAIIIAASGRSSAPDIFMRFSPSYQIGAVLCIFGIAITIILLPGMILPSSKVKTAPLQAGGTE